MVGLRARLGELEGDQREAVRIVSSNGHGSALDEERSNEFTTLEEELEECLIELRELGVQIKDAKTGLIDFPAVRNGADVLLCWRLGEDSVDHWHDLDSGFAGREPVDWDSSSGGGE
jgi:hypothetical protein